MISNQKKIISHISKIILLFILFSCTTPSSESGDNNGDGGTPKTHPEINVKGDTIDIPDGTSGYDIGSIVVNTSKDITFTIENIGKAGLNLTGDPRVSISGAGFSLKTDASPSISAGGISEFVITFTPTAIGSYTGTILIINNDSNENPYNFTINGNSTAVPIPEVNIKEDNVNIPDGTSNYNIGSTVINTEKDIIFTIENTGTADLSLTGIPRVSVGGTDFYLKTDAASNILPGDSSEFVITFNPQTTGTLTGLISISNDDSNENPYNFTINGNGTPVPVPEVNIKEDNVNIPDGTSNYNIGSTVINTEKDIIFTIENTGTADLSLTGTPRVSISGTDFCIKTDAASNISPGDSSEFVITFNPQTTGTFTGTISISNDDSDENPYNFTVTGKSTAPEINIKDGTTDIADDTTGYYIGSIMIGNSKDITFTIENTGTADLSLTGTPRVSVSGTDFCLKTDAASNISPGDSSEFVITFNPQTTGSFTGTISISNDDSNKNPYNFTIVGETTAPEINIKEGTTDIADDTTGYDIGSIMIGNSKDITFTIENTGTADLNLRGSELSITGEHFTIKSYPDSVISPGNTSDFTITFSPLIAGTFDCNITVRSNDSDERNYDFTIKGTSTEILIDDFESGNFQGAPWTASSFEYNEVMITTIDEYEGNYSTWIPSYAFLEISIETSQDSILSYYVNSTKVKFRVYDNGTVIKDQDTLETGWRNITHNLTAGTHTIRWEAIYGGYSSQWLKLDYITIGTDYEFIDKMLVYTDDVNLTSSSGTFNIGRSKTDEPSEKTFYIKNFSHSTLNLTGTPIVELSDNSNFSILSEPDSSIAGGSTSSFTVQCEPYDRVGDISTTASIPNSFASGAPYTFDILSKSIVFDDFESGDFSTLDWESIGEVNPIIQSNETYDGSSYAVELGNVGASDQCILQTQIRSNEALTVVSFKYKVSANRLNNIFAIKVNGVNKGSWSGEVDWTSFSYTISGGGLITIEFLYTEKYGTPSSGADKAWIDDFNFYTIDVL